MQKDIRNYQSLSVLTTVSGVFEYIGTHIGSQLRTMVNTHPSEMADISPLHHTYICTYIHTSPTHLYPVQ